MWAELFRRAADPEVVVSDQTVAALREELRREDIQAESAGPDLAQIEQALSDWSAREAKSFQELASSAMAADCLGQYRQSVVRDTLPLAAVRGCWLQGLTSSPTLSETAKLAVLTLLAGDVGAGMPRASRYDHVKTSLHRVGLGQYAIEPIDLSICRDLPDESFCWPALLLTMSRRTGDFVPELVGIDLAFRSLAALPWWSGWVSEQIAEPGEIGVALPDLDSRLESGNALRLSRLLACEVSLQSDQFARRVAQASQWCLARLRDFGARARANGEAAIDPALAMRALLRERGAVASSYHRTTKLGHCSLADWFSQACTDSEPLLAALAQSRWVRPGRPEESPLLTTLVDPAGPMFRIFTGEDLGIMRRWIASLAEPTPARPGSGAAEPPPSRLHRPASQVPDVAPRPRRRIASLREAYFVLQQDDGSIAIRDYAFAYAERWLKRAERSLKWSKHRLPPRWTTGALQAWVEERHGEHRTEFEDRAAFPIADRNDVIDSTLQLAPLTLLDGKWLEGFADWRLAASQIGHLLFATYWDELGNGQHELNHPKIYRDILREMGIELADTASQDFAYDRRFDTRSFEVPVYWQCLSRFPVTFMPETLGLNLAMELSGVGGGYMNARAFLRAHGFSTTFVDIHNTIDNVATGHTAWAVSAIDAYMATQIERRQDEDTLWRRVRVGYESLAPSRGSPGQRVLAAAPLAWLTGRRSIRRPAYAPQVV